MLNRGNFNESINEIESEPLSALDEISNTIQVTEAFEISETRKLSCCQKFRQLKLRYRVFILTCTFLIILALIAAILFIIYVHYFKVTQYQ